MFAEGYGVNVAGNRCIPTCTNECKFGVCLAPDVCKCEPGYGGPACDISCPPMTWGRDCSKKCDCESGATCDPYNGKCKCGKGFIGARCEEKCPQGKYGEGCSEVCRCENEGDCDHISGECICQPGWTGPL